MGVLEDVMRALERVPIWKRVAKLPDEVEALEIRIKALEDKLSGPKGQICPKCGDPKLMFINSRPHPDFGFAGDKVDTYKCSACGFEEDRDRSTRD